jgi:hypothetical protein
MSFGNAQVILEMTVWLANQPVTAPAPGPTTEARPFSSTLATDSFDEENYTQRVTSSIRPFE